MARKFPDENFAIIDYSVMAPPFTDAAKNVATPKNVQGLTFATNENSYLIGCMAAMMAKKQGGAGDLRGRRPQPPDGEHLHRRLPGRREGLQPGHQVLVGFSQDFVAQDKCKEIALNQIARARRSCSRSPAAAASARSTRRRRRAWGVGVDRDQSDLGPHILTSAVKRVDTSVFDTVKAAGGDVQARHGRALQPRERRRRVGKTSDKVTQDILDKVDELKQQIIDGEIKPKSTL